MTEYDEGKDRLYAAMAANDERGDMELHDIGWAVRQLKKDKDVTRHGWNGKGQYISLMESSPGDDMTLDFVYIRTVDGEFVPWLCSQTDLLSDDWELA